MAVHLIGYGAGNLGSVLRAFARIGVPAHVAEDPAQLADATHVLLPGVGSFAAAMTVLCRDGWDVALREHVEAGKPLLGICLGMQLLGSTGDEGGPTEGLSFIPGRVQHLTQTGCSLRLPHIGWNEVAILRPSRILVDVPDATDFYFAHSFSLATDEAESVVGRTEYGTPITVVVEAGDVFGVQFHPEKSSTAGLVILRNFAELAPC